MPFAVRCPSCGATLQAPETAAGRVAKCKKCGNRITIPAPPVAPTALVAPAPSPAADGFDFQAQENGASGPRRRRGGNGVWIGASVAGAVALLALCAGGTYLVFRVAATRATENSPDYMPAQDGSKWEYDFELQVGALPVQKGTLVTRIEGREEIGGKTYFKAVDVTSGIPGLDEETTYCRRDASGWYAINEKDRKIGERLLLPDPPKIGKEWTGKDQRGDYRKRIEGETDAHTVDRTYQRCLKIHTTVTGDERDGASDSYYSPGVGVVKSVVLIHDRQHGRDISITSTLKKYTP